MFRIDGQARAPKYTHQQMNPHERRGKRGGGGDYRVASPGGTGAEKATVSPHGRQLRDLAAEGLDDGREAPVRRLEIGCGAQEVTACRR